MYVYLWNGVRTHSKHIYYSLSYCIHWLADRYTKQITALLHSTTLLSCRCTMSRSLHWADHDIGSDHSFQKSHAITELGKPSMTNRVSQLRTWNRLKCVYYTLFLKPSSQALNWKRPDTTPSSGIYQLKTSSSLMQPVGLNCTSSSSLVAFVRVGLVLSSIIESLEGALLSLYRCVFNWFAYRKLIMHYFGITLWRKHNHSLVDFVNMICKPICILICTLPCMQYSWKNANPEKYIWLRKVSSC